MPAQRFEDGIGIQPAVRRAFRPSIAQAERRCRAEISKRGNRQMGLLLEIKAGPSAGKKVPLLAGNSVLIGRAADRAQFAIPRDSHMSGVHFAVECTARGCRVIDKKSTNGTFLNGARIQEGMLASGDEIKAGQSVFVVRIVPDDQLPPASSISQPASPAQAGAPKQL